MADPRLIRRLAEQARERRERRRRWAWALLLLLLPAAWWCREDEAPPAPAPAPDPVVGGGEAPAPAPPPPPERSPRVGTLPRPTFAVPSSPRTPWVDALRVQVAARGPRLAACFVGAAHPGALRWTAAVEPVSGAISESALSATAGEADLTDAQRACVLGVLAEPPFRLDAATAPATPVRVAMVLEF